MKRDPVVLIVDDSTTTRRMIERVIGMTQMPVERIEEAADGQAALDILNSTHVDLVMADLNMPVMDGYELIRRMRQSDALARVPVVVISAQPDTHHIEELNEFVAGYLPKPFTAEGIKNLIEPLLAPPPPPQPEDIKSHINMNLAEALAEALETMAFINPELHPNPAAPEDARTVRVEFKGAGGTGCLTVSASQQFAEMVASNCNAGTSESESDDALKELANVTCGLLLRKRVGGATGFEMAPPAMTTNPEWACAGPDAVGFVAEGYPILACVKGDWSGLETEEEA